jgi:DNA-binding transcriptional MerR regulator
MTSGNPEYPVFYDGKAPDALRTIGEVAKAMGIRQHVLRYWEEQFPMLEPVKRSGGRRYYRPEDIALIATIDRLVHREGYTLRGARKAIAEGLAGTDAAPTAAAVQPASPKPNILRELRSIREELAAALKSA